MRNQNFAAGEYYHLSARGVAGSEIFKDDADRARFIFLIVHLQSPLRIYNIAWYANMFLKRGSFNTPEKRQHQITAGRNVALSTFALSPSQFHLVVKNLEEGLVSVYMQRVLTAYGKYYNSKYNKKGHVFDGPFECVHIKNKDHGSYLAQYLGQDPSSFVKRSFKTLGFADPFVSFIP